MHGDHLDEYDKAIAEAINDPHLETCEAPIYPKDIRVRDETIKTLKAMRKTQKLQD